MEGIFDENIAKVIKLNDPDIPEYLDFDKLRKEGLEHIGELSGKIWTDHNVHDPGITILEVLIYALMDLGYKTNLPFQDLITSKDSQQEEDNFLTPLQILTINPVTILDYRKLLLECPGVRNAWIEPAPQEIKLSITQRNNTLTCGSTSNNRIQDCNDNPIDGNIVLNGLYKIYIEKNEEIEDNEQLKATVRNLWSQYRNLCEDLIDITILEPLDFGVCAEIEIKSDFEASKVYKQILLAIKEFIQPQVNYYTLKGLLDKGRSMDEIFAGRPYRLDSFGFIDTDEFDSLIRRKAIYLSDLYNIILNIDGVRKIKRIHIDGGTLLNVPSHIWVEGNRIENTEIPVFSLEKTCLDLYSPEGLLTIEKSKIHGTLLSFKKFNLSLDNLDISVPSGKFHADLSSYYSIQNDFPVVYGIGEDGLPDNASFTRQAQALQLKGYLLFYDQLLANYTSQLSNIRSIFSLKPEADRIPEEKQTYYTKIPDTVPGIENLLKFYNSGDIAQGTELALPVANNEKWQQALQQLQTNGRTVLTVGNYCEGKNGLVELFTFSSSTIRATYINQLIDAFKDDKYKVEVFQDRNGYFFVLSPSLPNDILLVGTKRYKEMELASNDARNVSFIASLLENYNLVTSKSEDISPDKHYFGLTYHPISYLQSLQEIVEDNKEYGQRRKKMLDHLLARFGEDFTDYTLLKYKQKINLEQLQEDTLNDQSAYLNDFAEISRNRGKAFDYLKPSWNTSNVSGFEKRISMLSGISNYERRHLCNFDVTPCFRLQLMDEKGEVLIKGNRSYGSKELFTRTAGKILKQLRDPSAYDNIKRKVIHFDTLIASRLFSTIPSEENIIVSKNQYHQQLLDINNEIVAINESDKYNTPKEAGEKKDDFIKNINKHTIKKAKENKGTYRLFPIKGREDYLDLNAFEVNIAQYSWWKWKMNNPTSKEKPLSEKTFATEEEAWKDVIENAAFDNYITEFEKAISWDVTVNDVVTLTASRLYVEMSMAQAAWEDAKTLAQKAVNYSYEKSSETTFRISLQTEKGIIAISAEINLEVFDPEATIRVCAQAFTEQKLKPEYTSLYQVYGFKISGENSFPTLFSYHRYSSQKEALEDLQKAYTLGISKRNYSQFGTEKDSAFGFRLLLDPGLPLAYHQSNYKTEKERTRVLNAAVRFFKKNQAPVSLQKQANQYTWNITGEFKGLIQTTDEFTSSAKAKIDFQKTLLAKAAEVDNEVLKPHFYHINIETIPVNFQFLYGNTRNNNEFNPLFISNKYFLSPDIAKQGYAKFANHLPQLVFKTNESGETAFDFALYESSGEKPVAVQYQEDSQKASLEEAKVVVKYIQEVYNPISSNVSGDYISNEMLVNREGLFGWKFYKKNDPLAVNPYRCVEKANAEEIASAICDQVPPIDLNYCPSKEIVISPEKDPYKFHYQIYFNDKNGLEFILISYVGYGSYEEAFEAWEKEWYEVITLAKNTSEYGNGGKINLDESYKPEDDNSCDDASYIAVIPEENKLKLIEAGIDVVTYYTTMAHLFPIYEFKKEEKSFYKFKVVIVEEGLANSNCNILDPAIPIDAFGSLIWMGTDEYSCYTEAVKAYNHFYILAGTSQNCQILCEKGMYYVALIEVLVESFCKYLSEAEAWDDAFASIDANGEPSGRDSCGNCLPGGVRSFLYASDDPKNFIPVCIDGFWTFKVVAPEYFVITHACDYNSEKERDAAVEKWKSILQNLNCEDYLNFEIIQGENENSNVSLNSDFIGVASKSNSNDNRIKRICELVFTIRKCLENCSKNQLSNDELVNTLRICLLEKYTTDSWVSKLIENLEEYIDELLRFVTFFPVYASDNKHCYRIYWPDNDQDISENGLQPCGCEELSIEEEDGIDSACKTKYPFLGSNCYSCCEEALLAFQNLCLLIRNNEYTIECTRGSEYGPYSFQIIDTSQELGYHPQRYKGYQEVLDAIEFTLSCATNTGMHLLEHILLRPKTQEDCRQLGGNNNDESSCLLPICPDYCCPIDWYPDMQKDDPCAEGYPDVIHYLPGSDPYSFWATLALPSWIKQFRTQAARTVFEQLLYKEVPALVGLNILWLGPRDMCRFEDKFRRWLDWLQDSINLCDPNGKHPSCNIADDIKELESEMPCLSIPGADGDCNCGNYPVESINPCCLPPITEGTLFWGYCAPQPNEPNSNSTVLFRSESRAETLEQEGDALLLAKIRKRKPTYLANVERMDASIKNTKSYERTIFYLNNIPTIDGFVQLVNFFNQYSLTSNSNVQEFLNLLQNPTWHLLDRLVLEYSDGISENDLENLQKSISLLNEKGMKNKELSKGWNIEALASLAQKKPLTQINKILNG